MPDIATAFLDAQLVAELRLQQRTPESRERATQRRAAYDAPRGLISGPSSLANVDEDGTVHCFDPWMIAKSEPNREHAAYKSLRREGFEAWFPAGRKIKMLPQRFVSSKTRHKKRHVLLEDLRLPYAGYVFFRRLTSASQALQLQKLYELDGVLGVCAFGEHIALAEDYEIQMLRFKEDIGTYDVWDVTMSGKEFALADIRRTEAAKERWEKPPTVLGTLDTNQGRGLHLVEAFGRITRVITATGDMTVQR
jgi:hypothetical protein